MSRQSGLCMIALMSSVTYALAGADERGGCSLTLLFGYDPGDGGQRAVFAAGKKLLSVCMLPSWLSWLDGLEVRSGFQMPGVLAFCGTGAQVTALIILAVRLGALNT